MVRNIFLARIYFTDRQSFKIRPILIVKQLSAEDFLYLPLTSNLEMKGLEISATALEKGELKKPAVVAVPKLNVIHSSLLMKPLGILKTEAFAVVAQTICQELGCKRYLV